jgi:methionine sulfoxide reductase heme-binding subunit
MPAVSDAVNAFLKSRWFYPAVFVACAWPGAVLLWNALPLLLPLALPTVSLPWEGDLGVNPVETLLHRTGKTAVTILLVALAVTPIRRLTGWNRVQLVRRMVGVWSFVYALCHFATYVVFDKLGDLQAITEDVFKRKFIFSGMAAFVILLVLAATSTGGMIRRLGKRWLTLHRLVYVAGLAAIIHFVWGQKADIRQPLGYAFALVVLLGYRVVLATRQRVSKLASAVSH